jgi:hypothetical protein
MQKKERRVMKKNKIGMMKFETEKNMMIERRAVFAHSSEERSV